ncbi:MAG: hypothetical protein OHK0048_08000 [Rhodoferax sp.]
MNPTASLAVLGKPDPRASVSLRITDTQRVPVTLALLAAAVFFLLLGGKNAWQREWLVTGLCTVAVLMALVYARAIYRVEPNPVGDVPLAALVWTVLAATVFKRDLVGVLWSPVLMLMLHLVVRRRVSLVFDLASIALATSYCAALHDADTAFRVAAILIITSAFAHIYARNAEGHQRVLDQQRRHLDLLIRCAAIGGLEWKAPDGPATVSARLADWLGLDEGPQPMSAVQNRVAPEQQAEFRAHLDELVHGPMPPLGSRQVPPMDLRCVRQDGREVWLHAEFMALGDEKGVPSKVVATFIDVSRLREAEANTLAALRRQQQLAELRARFVAMTSHEFRTPLAAILSSAELLENYMERLSQPERIAILRGIHDGVGRMTHMLDRILLINKADAQMLEFKPVAVEVQPLLAHIAAELEPHSSQQRIQIEVEPAGATARLDPKLIHHILGNLLSNALKYSDQGVLLQARCGIVEVRFVVQDHGIGIPEADLPDLFEPFHRASNVGERQGTGLGLTLVRKSAELHGGTVTVSSRVGEGTRFEVVLRQGGQP